MSLDPWGLGSMHWSRAEEDRWSIRRCFANARTKTGGLERFVENSDNLVDRKRYPSLFPEVTIKHGLG
jgi:hypothetical protein